MGHLKALSFKILLNGLPLFLILFLLGRLNWVTAIILTLAVIVVAYIVGDLVILPETGNFTATVMDGGLVFFILWASRYLGVPVNFFTIALSTVVVVMAEGLVYHPYLKRLVSADSMGPRIGKRE